MALKEPVRITLTIFPDDDPRLVAWAAALPTSRQRRRTAFIRAILANGEGREQVAAPHEYVQMASSHEGVQPASRATAPEPASVAAAGRKKKVPAKTESAQEPAPASPRGAPHVELHPADLAEIFST